ncbi:O-methyltransferase [Pedobacter alpinus]|uniref:O-methyltransferase n=2 Tax=Pedobacter alpinus TaxID=1590643 RepID=A0ABW5TNU8_9SPHI
MSAKTRHGTHSPFVYNLVDKVIYNFKDNSDYNNLENLRESLLKDESVITITDLGAGSQVNNKKQKKIKSLAKNALKPKKLAQLLYRLAKEFKPNNLIELGTCLGLTTAYFSVAVPNAKITTMEGCPQTAKSAQQNWEKLNLSNINVEIGDFDDNLPKVLAKEENIDFVFIDGNHRKQATLNYFDWCLPKVHDKTVLIFDDIYWSVGMKEAWEEIKNHPDVTVTIDLFWIGLVFFKTDQAKQNFKIKF